MISFLRVKQINNIKWSLLMLILALVCTINLEVMLISFGILIIVLIYTYFREKGLIFLILTAYMTLVGEINPQLRMAVHFFGFGGLLLLFLINYGFNFKDYKSVPSSIIYFLILLFIAMILSTSFSNYPELGVLKILQLIYLFLIIYLTYSLIKNEKDLKVVIFSLIASGIFMSLSVIINMFKYGFDPLKLVVNPEYRSAGFLSNINALNLFFAVGIPLSIALLKHPQYYKNRPFLIISIFIMVLGLITTISRAVILSIIISVGILLFYFHRKIFFKIFIITSLLLLVILLSPLADAFVLLFRLEEGLSRRDLLWQLAFNMISSNPLVGIGPGAYSYEMFNYFPVILNSYEGQVFVDLQQKTMGFNNSHNFYLVLFTDLGILGLIVALLLPYIFIRYALKLIKLLKVLKPEDYRMNFGFLAIGIGLFVRGLFEGISLITYGWITTDLPFWLIFVLLIHNYKTHIAMIQKQNG